MTQELSKELPGGQAIGPTNSPTDVHKATMGLRSTEMEDAILLGIMVMGTTASREDCEMQRVIYLGMVIVFLDEEVKGTSPRTATMRSTVGPDAA